MASSIQSVFLNRNYTWGVNRLVREGAGKEECGTDWDSVLGSWGGSGRVLTLEGRVCGYGKVTGGRRRRGRLLCRAGGGKGGGMGPGSGPCS